MDCHLSFKDFLQGQNFQNKFEKPVAVVGVTSFPNINVGISALITAGLKCGSVVFIVVRNIGIQFWFIKRLIKSILDVECYQIWLLRLLHGKEPACSAKDTGLIPGSGRAPGEGNAIHSSILARKFPWTEESGRLQSMG